MSPRYAPPVVGLSTRASYPSTLSSFRLVRDGSEGNRERPVPAEWRRVEGYEVRDEVRKARHRSGTERRESDGMWLAPSLARFVHAVLRLSLFVVHSSFTHLPIRSGSRPGTEGDGTEGPGSEPRERQGETDGRGDPRDSRSLLPRPLPRAALCSSGPPFSRPFLTSHGTRRT